jgi:hypothetical protein
MGSRKRVGIGFIGGIDSSESIPGLLESLKILVLESFMCTLSKLWPLIYARESTFQKCKMI